MLYFKFPFPKLMKYYFLPCLSSYLVQPVNEVVRVGANISVAYNNMHTFVTHTIWPCMSTLAFFLLLPFWGWGWRDSPHLGPCWSYGKQKRGPGRKWLGKKGPQSSGKIILSWERRAHGEESKSMNSKSSWPPVFICLLDTLFQVRKQRIWTGKLKWTNFTCFFILNLLWPIP